MFKSNNHLTHIFGDSRNMISVYHSAQIKFFVTSNGHFRIKYGRIRLLQ